MQIETKQTVTSDKLEANKDPLILACHPLGKLEFIAGAISSLSAYGQDSIEIESAAFMGEIIADSVEELWAVVNAGMARIDALEAQVKAYQSVIPSSPANQGTGVNHAE